MPKLPGISHQRAVRAFRKIGFVIDAEGKHITMTDGRRTIVIPRARPINAYTMGAILQGAGISVEEFKKLL